MRLILLSLLGCFSVALLPPGTAPIFQRLQEKVLERALQADSSLSLLPSLPSLPELPSVNGFTQALQDLIESTSTIPEVAALNGVLSGVLSEFQSSFATIPGLLEANPLILAPLAQLALIIPLAALASSSPSSTEDGNEARVYKMRRYSPEDAEEFFSRRPLLTAARAVQLASTGGLFGLALLVDSTTGAWKRNEVKRAAELTKLLVKLGPTFIKIGQSLSIRTDLLSPVYLSSLAQLQDDVPAFPSEEACRIVERELGQPVSEIYLGLTPTSEVVAAASLGQVYKCTLATSGEVVAVKVQRPFVEQKIALDMHLLRTAAAPLKQLFKLQSDTLGIVDDWGRGFIAELNYEQEALNSKEFTRCIADTPLGSSVFAPSVVDECSSERVLTTAWVEGERLERCQPGEQLLMLRLAMNAYLTMMLETPFLHADPHPGNLRRTPDGRLCIMDWGLVTSLEPGLQVVMIEHIAHLTSKDYARVPADLVKLGFIPQGMESVAGASGVVEVLADVYSRWAKGGGAAKVDVAAVINDLNGLTKTYGNLFQLPPYFAYIAKAFGVLEGIGLTNNPDFAIVSECMPYIARRLLTRPDQATGAALRSFVYGKQADLEPSKRSFEVDRIELLFKGIESYRSASAARSSSSSPSSSSSLSSSSSSSSSSSPSLSSLSSFPSLSSSSRSSMPQDSRTSPSVTTSPTSRSGKTLSASEISDAANAVLDLVLSQSQSQLENQKFIPSPLQSLLAEEGAKVVAAAARMQFSSLRAASGRLPSGRTALGLLVDPLGFFEGSRLVEADDADRQVIDQATALLELIVSTSSGGVGENHRVRDGGDSHSLASGSEANLVGQHAGVTDVLTLSRRAAQSALETIRSMSGSERRQLAQTLTTKVLQRREEAAGLGLLFVQSLVGQASGRAREARLNKPTNNVNA